MDKQQPTLFINGHDRAQRIWALHKDTFDQYDAILVSERHHLHAFFYKITGKNLLLYGFAIALIIMMKLPMIAAFLILNIMNFYEKLTHYPMFGSVLYPRMNIFMLQFMGLPIGNNVIRTIGQSEQYRDGNQPYIKAIINKQKHSCCHP